MSLSRKRCLLVGVLLFLVAFIYTNFNTYLDVKNIQVKVVQKYSGVTEGKHSSLKFIVVYETLDHQYFDKYVSASYFTKVNTGDTLTIQLRPFDIHQTPKDNLVWFWGWIITTTLCYISSIAFLAMFVFDKLRRQFFN